MVDVAVLGAGSWGTTFAKVLADGGSRVTMWARRPEAAREIAESRRNTRYLPGITLPATLTATADAAEAVALAAQLSTDDSPEFVNGLLGRLQQVKPTLLA